MRADEFEDANLDTLGFETSLEHQRLRASAAELRYREEIQNKININNKTTNPSIVHSEEYRLTPTPPLEDITQPFHSHEALDKVIGHLHKVRQTLNPKP